MRAATHARREQRLLAVDRFDPTMHLASADSLGQFLRAGDLVIVNDAATLPASLPARSGRGEPLEVRLARRLGPSLWQAVLMGAGSWRDDTDARGTPPRLEPEDILHIGAALSAQVVSLAPESPRLVVLRFDTDESRLYAAIYREGRAIQYSYHDRELPLRWLQSPFAGRPWAVEMPSAGRLLSWKHLIALRKAGVHLATLTHSAGLSATGDATLDALLPLPERYEIPGETIAAIRNARAQGGRIIAVGTTVVRALEGCAADHGQLKAGPGETDLVLSESHVLRVVDGVISGLHANGESHHKLLSAFASVAQLDAAYQLAEERGFQNHELGDAMLLLPKLSRENLSNSATAHAPHHLLSRSGVGAKGCQVPRAHGRGPLGASARLSRTVSAATGGQARIAPDRV